MGLLATDAVYEFVATTYQRVSQLDRDALQTRFEELEGLATSQLGDDGIPEDRRVIQRVADCRYLGQGYELRIDCPSGPIDDAWIAKVTADFHDAHEREYSRRFDESDIEIPNIRIRGIGIMPELRTPEIETGSEGPEDALRHEKDAWFRVDGVLSQVPTKYYAREALKAGNRVQGPAVINQYDSTTVIPPGFTAGIDQFGNIVITIDALATQQVVGAAHAAEA
jgi:N-methylhydantoinase A/oxoprolinase/acetone carboxylase beta subunit